MRHREQILTPLGFKVLYYTRPKYRGAAPGELCMAWRERKEYFVALDPGHFGRLHGLQAAIPGMARIAERVEDCVVFEKAPGRLLWDCDPPPDPGRLEPQLEAFAAATRALGLMHADIRPWNAFWHPTTGLQMIDWGHGGFVDEMRLDSFALGHLRATNHREWPLRDLAAIDGEDARRLVRLVKGDIGLKEAWNAAGLGWLPPWCKP